MSSKQITFRIDAEDNASSKFSAIKSSAEKLSKTYDGVTSSFSNFSSRFSTEIGLLEGAASAAAKGILGLGAALTAAAGFSVKSAASYEQVRVAFEAMLGSAEKAKVLMKEVSDFAAKTPFEVPEVVNAGKQLLAFGVPAKDVVSKLTMIGDAASKMNVPMEQAIGVWAKAKAGMFDIAEFAPLGVTREELEKFGVTFKKTGEVVDRSKLGPALEKMWSSEGTVGMMERQSRTFNGTISNISDSIGRFARELIGVEENGDIREGSVFFKLKNAAVGFLTWLDQHKDEIARSITGFIDSSMQKGKEWIDQMGGPEGIKQKFIEFWNTLKNDVIPAIGEFISTVVNVTKFVWEHKDAIIAIFLAYESFKLLLTTGQVIQAVINFGLAIMGLGGSNGAVTLLTSSIGTLAGGGLAGALSLGLVGALMAVDAYIVSTAIKTYGELQTTLDGVKKHTDDATFANQNLQDKINNMEIGPAKEKLQQIHDETQKLIQAEKDIAERYSGLPGLFYSVYDQSIEWIEKLNEALSDLADKVAGLSKKGIKVKVNGDVYLPSEVNDVAGNVGIPGGRASGGPVSGNTPYIVGEVGPELFIPNSIGTIIPNNQLGGSTYNFNFQGATIADKSTLISEIKQVINREMELGRYGLA